VTFKLTVQVVPSSLIFPTAGLSTDLKGDLHTRDKSCHRMYSFKYEVDF